MKSFFYHFNKPQTQRAGKVQVSVHYDGKCYIVDNVACYVPVRGRIRKNQPRFVMAGRCKSFTIVDGVGEIR